jgi:hypothetical protein
MGKYFKEDNNQRISKASNLNVEALAEKAIRTAAGPINLQGIGQAAKGIGQAAKAIWNTANPFWQKIIKPTTLETSIGLNPGELGFIKPGGGASVIKPGKAPRAYEAGSFAPWMQGLSKLLNNIPGAGKIAKAITHFDFITSGEKYMPEVTKLLGQEYMVTDLGPGFPYAPKSTKVTLRMIVNGLDSNDVVQIGDKQLAFDEKTALTILADMKKLDEYAVKWAKIKTVIPAAVLAVGIPAIHKQLNTPANAKTNKDAAEAGKKAGKKAPSSYKTLEQNKSEAEKALADIMGKS